ncbi:MAG: nitrite reductase small subunit NirD [Vicinamibacterales bacterium]
MIENQWIRVSPTSHIPPREGRVVHLAEHEIAIFHLGDRFLAVQNRCPHKGGPLSDGIVAGDSIVCPLHAWKVHLESGQIQRPGGQVQCVERYPVRVQHGVIEVQLAVIAAEVTCGGAAA